MVGDAVEVRWAEKTPPVVPVVIALGAEVESDEEAAVEVEVEVVGGCGVHGTDTGADGNAEWDWDWDLARVDDAESKAEVDAIGTAKTPCVVIGDVLGRAMDGAGALGTDTAETGDALVRDNATEGEDEDEDAGGPLAPIERGRDGTMLCGRDPPWID
jgi:hypothetical protein